MKLSKFFASIILISFLFTLNCLYVVTEGSSALVKRLGELSKSSDGTDFVAKPGLHVKLPIIDNVIYVNDKLQTFESITQTMLTVEQKYLEVDYFLKWRVVDHSSFYKRTGNDSQTAENILNQKMDDAIREAFGNSTMHDLISEDRDEVMKTMREKTEITADSLGVKIVDIRIKKIEFPSSVEQSVFERMNKGMKELANKYRANGEKAKVTIMADADAKVNVLLSDAASKSARIRAEGDFEAAKIYNDSFGKDPSFYEFLESMSVYKESFSNKSDFLVLGPDLHLFKHFKNG